MKIFISILFWSILFSSETQAQINITVKEVIETSFDKVDKIEHKSLLLNSSQFKHIQSKAKAKMTTKLYRYYNILSKDKILGKGILIIYKMRTKKATILYAFDNNNTLRFTEIMAFGEPPEFIPNSTWMEQFQKQEPTVEFRIGKDIPTISGSTLSARSITQGARIARAIYEIVLKNK